MDLETTQRRSATGNEMKFNAFFETSSILLGETKLNN